jgi:hypothetical protein
VDLILEGTVALADSGALGRGCADEAPPFLFRDPDGVGDVWLAIGFRSIDVSSPFILERRRSVWPGMPWSRGERLPPAVGPGVSLTGLTRQEIWVPNICRCLTPAGVCAHTTVRSVGWSACLQFGSRRVSASLHGPSDSSILTPLLR